MSRADLVKEVLAVTPTSVSSQTRALAIGGVICGAVGLGLGFFVGPTHAGWTALLVGTALVLGLGVVGVLLSAIFQMTGARWGRAYRRLAEGSAALMPLGVLGVLTLMLGGDAYLPWVHEHPHVGGKAVWLVRGFWDARVLGALLAVDALSLLFLYYSLRRDFCVKSVGERYKGIVARWVARGIKDPAAERARCEARLTVLAPVVAIVYAVCLSLLGFDLIMALEPDWFSTLFGAWYFIGHLFGGMALLAIISVVLRGRWGLERFLTEQRQADLATLLFAFCLINTDFFWNQFLTIWYANLPEETFWLVERTVDSGLPWPTLSWAALIGFFFIPFFALLIRRVKRSGAALSGVALLVVAAVFLLRFIEVAPALLDVTAPAGLSAVAVPLLSAVLVYIGLLGAGLWLYAGFMTQVPAFPVGDDIFVREFSSEEVHP